MIRDSLWRFIASRFDYGCAMFASSVNLSKAWLNGVHIGGGCRFFGYSTFVKSRKSAINIGKRCVFRSSKTSNLIGVNRPCIFTAHMEGVLVVGDNCGFSGTVIGCFRGITLGNNVRCGANTLITDGDWHLDDTRSAEPRPIAIEDNVWLGVNVIVLKGVTIGRNSVIGAGSVVTSNIPENVVAAGNPCRVIKSLQ